MARNRINSEDGKLPHKVYKNKYSYYYKPNSKLTITLCPLSSSMSEVWAKYDYEVAKKIYQTTFKKLWAKFIDSPYFSELAKRTQHDYHQHSKKLLKVFGDMPADNIKTHFIRQYMDLRGKQSKTQANHEFSSMSKVYNWGYERGYVSNNPCKGVSKFSISARDIYVTDEEYYAILNEATPSIKIAMEISYLCAVREGDIINMKWSQILEEGIFIQQGKTGVKQIKLWNDRLRSIIAFAKNNNPPKSNNSLLMTNKEGNKYNRKTFNTNWLDAKKKAEQKLGREINIHFHDLKAKSISDFAGSSKDKQIFSGHKTESQVLVYDRKTKKSPSLNV